MKRTAVFDYEIMGSVSSWPVQVAISQNRKSGLWTLYFNYVDPDALAFEKHRVATPEEFRSAAEEHFMDIDSFCDALVASANTDLHKLGMFIRNSSSNPASPEIPEKFWKIRDAAIEHVLSNSTLPSGLGKLQDWLAADGWEYLLAAWIDEDVALNLRDLATYKFTDSSLRDDESLEDAVVITDQMRIDHARSAISDAFDEKLGDCSQSVHSFPIERRDGERAILGCTVEIQGQFGPVPEWHGVFSDRDDFYRCLRKAGFLFNREASKIDKTEILALWHKDKKASKRKTPSS